MNEALYDPEAGLGNVSTDESMMEDYRPYLYPLRRYSLFFCHGSAVSISSDFPRDGKSFTNIIPAQQSFKLFLQWLKNLTYGIRLVLVTVSISRIGKALNIPTNEKS